MKNITKLFALICVMAMAQFTFAQISGTAHDFTGEAWRGLTGDTINGAGGIYTTTTEICVVCHTPHNGDLTTVAPLWNRQSSVASYTPYASSTMESSPATGTALGAYSKICLSCHDGTVGLESFGGVNTNTNPMTGRALVGTDLSNDHPVSMVYNTALVGTGAGQDDGLYDPSTQTSGLGGTINADMLFSNQVECASCHDVHDNTNGMFLRKSNGGSDLCLTCHIK